MKWLLIVTKIVIIKFWLLDNYKIWI